MYICIHRGFGFKAVLYVKCILVPFHLVPHCWSCLGRRKIKSQSLLVAESSRPIVTFGGVDKTHEDYLLPRSWALPYLNLLSYKLKSF